MLIRCSLNQLTRTHKLGIVWQVSYWCIVPVMEAVDHSCSSVVRETPAKSSFYKKKPLHTVNVCEGLYYYQRENT